MQRHSVAPVARIAASLPGVATAGVKAIADNHPILIVGAGMGGLAAAIALAARGAAVTVIESADSPGGKARQLMLGTVPIDAGPTVFTMRDVFDSLFEMAGARLDDEVRLAPCTLLARHAWDAGRQLDLHADADASEAAIGDFAGAEAAAGFRSFSKEARRVFEVVDRPFMRSGKTNPLGLMWRIGPWRLGALHAIRPYEKLWAALCRHFADPRLRQLFARYSTYCGSSPFQAPATLMLIAHVEQRGVWAIDGGITALADAMERVARRLGVQFRYGAAVQRIMTAQGRVSGVALAHGEQLAAKQIIFNGDPAALAGGLLGDAVRAATRPARAATRSLSALVWLVRAQAHGFPLAHHNVFFSDDYRREFAELAAGSAPSGPTAYVCALDRGFGAQPHGPERFQIIVNAPANGDGCDMDSEEKERCTAIMLKRLQACGLRLDAPLRHIMLTPHDFAARFPGTSGALYGRASHGWAASFLRPGSRTSIPGLYCAGGATHPGAGVPMAALSGMLASQALLDDLVSMRTSRHKAIAGGMSMHSAPTKPMA